MPPEALDVEGIARELSDASDVLRLELETTELVLSAIGFGVVCEVPLTPANPDGPKLGYGKIGKDWRLYIIHEPDGEKKHLSKCSRWDRVQATTRLEDLLEALVGSSQEKLDDVRDAIGVVRAFNERVKALIKDD